MGCAVKYEFLSPDLLLSDSNIVIKLRNPGRIVLDHGASGRSASS